MSRIVTALAFIVFACGCGGRDEVSIVGDVPATPRRQANDAPLASQRPALPPLDEAAGALAKSNAEFAIDLYRQLSGKPGNIVVSPYSISAALAMTYDGARGDTAEQMARVLRFPAPRQLNPAFLNLSRNLTAPSDGFEMTVANALWPRNGIVLEEEFLRDMHEFFGTSVQALDYASASGRLAARKTINDWTSRQTRTKIKDLIGENDLESNTTLVLTNAIYSKGEWAQQFSPSRTRNADFHLSPERTVKTPMMSQAGKFNYFVNDKLSILELPYRGNRASFIAVLPDVNESLASIEAELSAKALQELISKLTPHGVDVLLPRLTLKYRANLKDDLKAMGMPLPFTLAADFSGIGPVGWIDKVIHEATLDVDEKGVVATAATAVIMVDSAPSFAANRPFLFLIRDQASGSILFLGRIVDPTAK